MKDEVYRVAGRVGMAVKVVANTWTRTPPAPWIEAVVVDAGPDAADGWIAARAGPGDVVITADLPLADRCLKAGAEVVSPRGTVFTADSIGAALAGRAVGEHLRSMGAPTSGPPPFGRADRSTFLQALDAAVTRARRRRTKP